MVGGAARPGDAALTNMLAFHGVTMNGGFLHAIEVFDESEREAVLRGYRYFGFGAVSDLIAEMTERFGETATLEAEEVLEVESDERYGQLASDAILMERFEETYRDRGEDFAPLSQEDLAKNKAAGLHLLEAVEELNRRHDR